ncbi:hypothetical protein GCM10009430_43100 [Aquimarina litoralis]|uniref:Uncharacterized protein n=1 Tax=Aquimarina litoralis TaxID=584605 RepID=A0ABN1J7Q1_9FLAO
MPGTNGDQPNDDKPKNIFERVKDAYKQRKERKARERQRREEEYRIDLRRISGSRENRELREQQYQERLAQQRRERQERQEARDIDLDPRETFVEAHMAKEQPKNSQPGEMYRDEDGKRYVKAYVEVEENNLSERDVNGSSTSLISKEKLTNLTEQPKEKAEENEKAKAIEKDKNNRNSQDSTRGNKSNKRRSQGRNL